MSITLQDFAPGDTNYVAKLNANNDVLEAAIAAVQALTSGGLFAQPYEVAGAVAGVPGSSAVVIRYVFPRSVAFPIGLTESQGVAGVAATAQADFAIIRNGSGIGTMRFAASATVATFIFTAAVTFVPGDILTITAPASVDATLANIAFVLVGAR